LALDTKLPIPPTLCTGFQVVEVEAEFSAFNSSARDSTINDVIDKGRLWLDSTCQKRPETPLGVLIVDWWLGENVGRRDVQPRSGPTDFGPILDRRGGRYCAIRIFYLI
jgi:hypothetical protein